MATERHARRTGLGVAGVGAEYHFQIPKCDIFYPSSPRKSACLKYFIPTHATTTHTQAITHVNTSNAG
jgi:hypothetical protein